MKIGFNKQFKSYSIFDVDQFTLDKDEVARICCIEDPSQGVEVAFAHWVQVSADRGGYYQCLGDWNYLQGTPGKPAPTSDPDRCPFCKRQAKNSPVGEVTRRFATNVMIYATDNKGNIRQPLSAYCKVWRFGDDKYNRLADIADQYGDPTWGIRIIDLMVKCNQKQYQRFEIDPARQCLWTSSGDIFKQQFIEQWKAARMTEFGELLGTKVADVAAAEKLISEASGAPVQGSAGGQAPMAAPQDLQRLLDESMTAAPTQVGYSNGTPAPPVQRGPAPPQFVGNQAPAPAPTQNFPPPPPPTQPMPPPPAQPPQPVPHQSSPTQAAPTVPPATDFDSLLKL